MDQHLKCPNFADLRQLLTLVGVCLQKRRGFHIEWKAGKWKYIFQSEKVKEICQTVKVGTMRGILRKYFVENHIAKGWFNTCGLNSAFKFALYSRKVPTNIIINKSCKIFFSIVQMTQKTMMKTNPH